MSQITVDTDLCAKDGACVAVCPSMTLRTNEEGFPEEVEGSGCIFCGHCVAVCTCDALTHSGLPQEPFLPVPSELPSAEALDGLLISRRSVREFEERPVPRKTLEAMLDVARRAPTAVNSQKLHWMVVDGGAKVQALSAETVNWMRSAGIGLSRMAQWERGYDFVLRGAPTVVMAATPADYEWGALDCAIAVTFLELAAEARGLGACWAGLLTRAARNYAPLREALKVPEGYTVHGGLMLGEPKFSYRLVPPRKPLSVEWI